MNLTEVLVAPAADAAKLTAARRAIATLGVTVHQPNESIAVDAARLRQRRPVSLPDSYCLATAKHTGSTIASFDQNILKAAQRERIAALSPRNEPRCSSAGSSTATPKRLLGKPRRVHDHWGESGRHTIVHRGTTAGCHNASSGRTHQAVALGRADA